MKSQTKAERIYTWSVLNGMEMARINRDTRSPCVSTKDRHFSSRPAAY